MVFSNRRRFKILIFMADLLVRIRFWVSVRANVNVGIGCRYENLKNDIDLRIGHRFKNLTKGHIYEVQMSVT